MNWTPEEDAMLQKLIADGYPYEQVSILLGKEFNRVFTRKAICGRIYRIRAGINTNVPRTNALTVKKDKAPGSVFKSDFKRGKYKLMDLKPDQCRYVFGVRGAYTYCGCKVMPDKSMCAEHYNLCYQPNNKKRMG